MTSLCLFKTGNLWFWPPEFGSVVHGRCLVHGVVHFIDQRLLLALGSHLVLWLSRKGLIGFELGWFLSF